MGFNVLRSPQGIMGDTAGITPLLTSLPALLAKSCSCYNPWVYAISHPKYRVVSHGSSLHSLITYQCILFIVLFYNARNLKGNKSLCCYSSFITVFSSLSPNRLLPSTCLGSVFMRQNLRATMTLSLTPPWPRKRPKQRDKVAQDI